jgi:cell wall-associated NlpC family hydrolase
MFSNRVDERCVETYLIRKRLFMKSIPQFLATLCVTALLLSPIPLVAQSQDAASAPAINEGDSASGLWESEITPGVAEESTTQPTSRPAAEIRRGMRMGETGQKSREQLYFERIISRVQDDFVGRPERLDKYIQLYKKELINDLRVFPTHIEAEWDEASETLTLSGYVGYVENHRTLIKLFTYLGFENIDDQMEVLPSADLGDKRFGFVSVTRSFTRDRRGEKMTETLLGDPLFLLKKLPEDKLLVLSNEGYVGVIPTQNVAIVNEAEFTRRRNAPQITFTRDVKVGDLKIPVGARIPNFGQRPGKPVALLPNDDKLPLSDSTSYLLHTHEPVPQKVTNSLAIADQFVGTPYVWGGNTTDGVDCSGLVQSSFKAVGLNLPRDADQQSYMGSLVATRWYRDGLRPGDTLYFLSGRSGRISHTAIYVGDDIYIESSSGGVSYGSFNPEHENYRERRYTGFCFAKRLVE